MKSKSIIFYLILFLHTNILAENLIIESKTQIKNISQEIEKPQSKLNENKITSKIRSLEDLISIAEKEKEIGLKFDLERNVRLVKFSKGKIDIAFNEKLSKTFIKNLTSKLSEWTGHRWIITLSKDEGSITAYEKKEKIKKNYLKKQKVVKFIKRLRSFFLTLNFVILKKKIF